jgi:hypothetical protein
MVCQKTDPSRLAVCRKLGVKGLAAHSSSGNLCGAVLS